MSPGVAQKILLEIESHRPGWAFSSKDFSHLGSREAIDVALYRLTEKGVVKRVMRGIYFSPVPGRLLKRPLSPDVDQVARALARKFGWSIQPSGSAALNLMGLSTQVPGSFSYLSNGPARDYRVNKVELSFEHAVLKEASFEHRESSIIVQGLRALGAELVNPKVVAKIRRWLRPELRPRVIEDTKIVTGWIYQAIRDICAEGNGG